MVNEEIKPNKPQGELAILTILSRPVHISRVISRFSSNIYANLTIKQKNKKIEKTALATISILSEQEHLMQQMAPFVLTQFLQHGT